MIAVLTLKQIAERHATRLIDPAGVDLATAQTATRAALAEVT